MPERKEIREDKREKEKATVYKKQASDSWISSETRKRQCTVSGFSRSACIPPYPAKTRFAAY